MPVKVGWKYLQKSMCTREASTRTSYKVQAADHLSSQCILLFTVSTARITTVATCMICFLVPGG